MFPNLVCSSSLFKRNIHNLFRKYVTPSLYRHYNMTADGMFPECYHDQYLWIIYIWFIIIHSIGYCLSLHMMPITFPELYHSHGRTIIQGMSVCFQCLSMFFSLKICSLGRLDLRCSERDLWFTWTSILEFYFSPIMKGGNWKHGFDFTIRRPPWHLHILNKGENELSRNVQVQMISSRIFAW